MDQWFVLQKAATPTEQQEEIQRANDQDLELEWIQQDSERSPKIITEHHPVRYHFICHVQSLGATLHWHSHPLRTIVSPRESDVVITGGEEGVIVLWYLNTHKQAFIPRVCPLIKHLASTDDGVRLAVCGNDNSLRFVEVSQKAIRATITGLGLGAIPFTPALHRAVRAGIAFDQQAQQLLVPMVGASALLQSYDPETDRACGIIGEARTETSKTHRSDVRGTRRVDLMRLSMDNAWLFTIERWVTSSGPHALWLKVYHRGEGNSWSLFAEIANPHHDRILCLAVNPQKNEVITTDGVGLVKVWGLIEKTSPLNNNESVSNDETYTWTCCHSFVHSEEPVTGISYSSDGTVYALSNPHSISLWSADTHTLLHVLPVPSPDSPVHMYPNSNHQIRSISFFHHSSILLATTDHTLFLWDTLTRQILWCLHGEIHASATTQYNPLDDPLFAVAVQSLSYFHDSFVESTQPSVDSILIFTPQSSTPIASVTLSTPVLAMVWGRDSVRLGRRLCLFALTERREIIKIVEGEASEEEESHGDEEKVTAFDEVFDVDLVEKRAQTIQAEKDYSNHCESE